jgi:hypothetical protein
MTAHAVGDGEETYAGIGNESVLVRFSNWSSV